MANDEQGRTGERDETAGAPSPAAGPTPRQAPVPGKETQIGRSLDRGHRGPARVGQQSLVEKEYGASGEATRSPGTFGEAAALLGVTPTAPAPTSAPSHHKANGHPPHSHGQQPAADAINSDDGQNATRADLLTVDPPAIRFGHVPFKTGRDQTEAAPYEVAVHNPTGDPITLDDIHSDAGADFPISSAAASTPIAPGGSFRFGVGFRPHHPGVQSTTIHVVSGGVSQARVTAEATALDEGSAWEDLRLSTHDVRFPDIALGQESAPRTVHVTNHSGVPVRIEDVAPTLGDGDQFHVHQASADEIPAGASTDLTVTFTPTRAGARHATFHVRTPGAHDKDAAHASIEMRGHGHAPRPTEGADALAASIDAGGVVGPMITYENMLDALHAAQRFTEAGSTADADAEHIRASYDRAEKLVAPVLARLDGLEQKVPALASTMGFSSTNTWQTFGAAHDPVRIWAGLLRGKSQIPADYYVRSFEVAKEVLQALTGEQKDAPTLRALGSAAKWTPLEVAGGAAAGGAIAYGGAAAVSVAGEAAAASPSVSYVVNTLASEWQNARWAFAAVSTWVMTNPDEANELATWLGSIGVTMIDAGGVREFFDQIQDVESFINIFGQMAEPVVNHQQATNAGRASAPDPMGLEPTTFSTGPRASANGEPEAQPSGGPRRATGTGDAEPAPSLGNARVLGRVRTFIDRVKGIASRTRGATTNAAGGNPTTADAQTNGTEPAPEEQPSTAPHGTGREHDRTAPRNEDLAAAPKTRKAPPKTIDEARARKATGESWSNKEIRDNYNARNQELQTLDERWRSSGLSAEERARKAYEIRHEMRLVSREMMGNSSEQLSLLIRDAQMYGDGGGPTFDALVAEQHARGLSGDAAYDAIVDGSQRTNRAVNQSVARGEPSASPSITLPPGATVHGDGIILKIGPAQYVEIRIKSSPTGKETRIQREVDGSYTVHIGKDAQPDAALSQVAHELTEFSRTPRQGSNDLDLLYDKAAIAQESLGELTRSVADELGGRPIVPEKLKGRARAQEKIATDYEGENARIADLARSSIEFDRYDQIEKAMGLIQQRAEVVRIKDRFKEPMDGYRDVMMNIRMPNGHIVEMQLHLRGILEVKNGPGHALYEQIRSIGARAKAEGRRPTVAEHAQVEALKAEMRMLYDEAFVQSLVEPDSGATP